MLSYVLRRLAYTVPLLLVISVVVFLVMNLSPGNYCTNLKLQSEALYQQCLGRTGVDQPLPVQYGKWIWGILSGLDFGYSFQNSQPVLAQLFTAGTFESGIPLVWTLVLSLGALALSWLLAVPLGVYAALHRGTWRDWFVNLFGFVGLSLPNFFLAIGLLWALVVVFQVGTNCWISPQLNENVCLGVSGLFDGGYVGAAWSVEKLLNLLWHLWPAFLVIAAANVAAITRTVRGEMLGVLGEPYVQTARAKGVRERVVIFKHAFKNALNPLISMLGYWLPQMFEGALVAAMILQLPTVEKAYWTALRQDDQYVAMGGLLFFSVVLVLGNLVSDVLLAWVNPKIRYQ